MTREELLIKELLEDLVVMTAVSEMENPDDLEMVAGVPTVSEITARYGG